MSTNQYVTDVPLIDYLRLATYDVIQFYNVTAAIERRFSQWRPKKWLQYKGRISDNGVFHGIGDQNGRAHCIIEISGYASQTFYTWWKALPAELTGTFYCTRIDLQCTKNRPDDEYRLKAYKRLRGAKSLIQSDSGITLYIGARTSDTYWRLYDKTEELLRVEVEIKGSLAKRAYASLRADEQITNVWNRFLLRSNVPTAYVEIYRADADIADLPDAEEEPDMQVKLDWLETLDGLIYKLAKDHDTHEQMTIMVKRWTEYCAEP